MITLNNLHVDRPAAEDRHVMHTFEFLEATSTNKAEFRSLMKQTGRYRETALTRLKLEIRNKAHSNNELFINAEVGLG